MQWKLGTYQYVLFASNCLCVLFMARDSICNAISICNVISIDLLHSYNASFFFLLYNDMKLLWIFRLILQIATQDSDMMAVASNNQN